MIVINRTYSIYCHTNTINGNQYIGMTGLKLNERFSNGEGYKECTYFYRAIKKYGWDAFETDVLFEGLTFEDAEQVERDTIEILNTMSPNGYNLQSGGGVNRYFAQETRDKMSRSQKGKVLSEEHKLKIGEAHMGRVVSLETRDKLRQANLGKVLSEGHKQAISDGLKNNPNRKLASKSINQYDLEGNLVGKWESASQASRELKFCRRSIGKVCGGEQFTSNGYIWRFTNDDSEIDLDEILENYKPSMKSVKLFDLDGNLLSKWNSHTELANYIGSSTSAVSKNIQYNRKTFMKEYRLEGCD